MALVPYAKVNTVNFLLQKCFTAYKEVLKKTNKQKNQRQIDSISASNVKAKELPYPKLLFLKKIYNHSQNI